MSINLARRISAAFMAAVVCFDVSECTIEDANDPPEFCLNSVARPMGGRRCGQAQKGQDR
jgi:hypothetical protein